MGTRIRYFVGKRGYSKVVVVIGGLFVVGRIGRGLSRVV